MATDSIVKTSTRTDVKEPGLFRVIYMNDEVTTMEFVIETMIVIFHLEREEAEHLTTKIHEEGSAVVAVLPYEIAEQKGVEITLNARSQNYPLQIKLEPEGVN